MKNFAIACGGTGGHISPGIALAEELSDNGHSCTLIISKKSIDSTMLAKYKQFKKIAIAAKPLAKSPLKFVKFTFSQILALIKCIIFIAKNKIDCVIAFGGFTSLPVVLAAFLLRKKIFLHESNQVVGKSIKFLARFANKIFTPEGTSEQLNKFSSKIITCGYPLRNEITQIDEFDAKKLFNLPENKKIIVVFGGSQGAIALSNWAIENSQILSSAGAFILCICGKNIKANNTSNIKLLSFCDNMAALYSCADLVIARAGAGTIAEIQKFGLKAILVPYPFAAEKHQHANAMAAAAKTEQITWIDEKEISKLTELSINFLHKPKTIFVTENINFAKKIADIVTA